MSNIQVEVFPRVHIGLISMHANGLRNNGGVGFSLQAPSARVTVKIASKLALKDRREHGMTEHECSKIVDTLKRACAHLHLSNDIEVIIDGGMMTHHGMGSGTAIRMACVEGLLIANGVSPTDGLIQQLSGRGGTSGVGINAYLTGGLHLDLGVPARDDREFLPSSRYLNPELPLAIKRCELPAWPVGVYVPLGCRSKTQHEELEFFKTAAPIDARFSFEAAYVALFGVIGSAIDDDYLGFCKSIDLLQSNEWKRLERGQYGDPLKNAEQWLRSHAVDCVGMSSFGPMLYFFASIDVLTRIQAEANARGEMVLITTPRNAGRHVISPC